MSYDAVVVGAGPNGLAAATTLAQAGHRVVVLEAAQTPGGGTRTAELTLPGFHHDVCAASHPLGAASPFFASLPLADHGLEWAVPAVQLAHPLDDGRAGLLYRSISRTSAALGADGPTWERTIGRIADDWDDLAPSLLGPLARLPRHPLALARFGMWALQPATRFAVTQFETEEARGLFAGSAAHAVRSLRQPAASSIGLVLSALAHVGGWPVAVGGTHAITIAMASYLASLGGEIATNTTVAARGDLPDADVVLFDTSPHTVAKVYGHDRTNRRLRTFRHGPAAFKVDYALDGPIPWDATEARHAGVVHVGGTMDEVAAAEQAVMEGRVAEQPFVLVGQQSIADATRAPAGKHTAWAYCHVPAGSTVDMRAAIDAQIERFAPGFGELVLAAHTTGPSDFAAYNENYVGGDIAGGSLAGMHLIGRAGIGPGPYRTGIDGVYICSASTPPGAGVHGMCGFNAARAALRDLA